MPWQQLKCSITPPQFEAISEYLESVGALAITVVDAEDNPIFEPEPGMTPLWQHSILIALFAHDLSLDSIKEMLIAKFTVTPLISPLADQAWERVCMDQFQPVPFGEKLWICPSWHHIDKEDAIVVNLDPGLAFGTGNHPTTRLCLAWLATHDLMGKTVIDYGCGSGILAIAAAKLGASKVYAIDIDPQALQATADNALRNQLSPEQIVTCHPSGLPKVKSDLLIANILANPLLMLYDTFVQLLKPQGSIVLSGILCEQIALISETYQHAFALQDTMTENEWGLVSAIKQSA
jgi:ribosomal protein L11 methyltransferase